MKNKAITTLIIGSLSLSPLVGCDSLPGDKETQGAVIGGVGGALGGALVGGEDNRLIGALIGGALGAGGGYLIGAQKDKLDREDRDEVREEAIRADQRATRNPATARDVERARTADVNDDGFVTLDEVIAMREANLSDREMIERLERTGQIFELTASQERQLEDEGVSRDVILAMRDLNRDDDDFARTASDRADERDRDFDRDDDRYDSSDRLDRDRDRIDRDDDDDDRLGSY